MGSAIRVARYLRVSRIEQNIHLQDDETKELAKRRGWVIAESYVDHGVSGTRERRPQLDRLLVDAKKRKFDAVLVWRADRLFRSLKNMVITPDEWSSMGVGFVSATEVFDSTTPQGRLLMHLTSAFAEFERSVIVERTKAGIAAARRRGARIGRPRVHVDDDQLLALNRSGKSVREIARALGVGSSTVQRRLGILGGGE
jgi:DNA invertase Pin-like site-specific DNA recombinase